MRAFVAEIKLAWLRALRTPALWIQLLLPCVLLFPIVKPLLATTLPLLWFALLLAGLWTSALAFSYDRQCNRLPLTITKPAPRILLWLGRLVGTTLPQTLSLIILGGILYFSYSLPDGRNVSSPLLPPTQTLAPLEFARLKSLNRIPEGVPLSQIMDAINQDLATRTTALNPGETHTYTFVNNDTKHATLRLTGYPFYGPKENIRLDVLVNGQKFVPIITREGFIVDLPNNTSEVILQRRDNVDAASVLYRPRQDLKMLTPKYSRLVNILYFVLVLWGVLFVSNAISMTFGIHLSMPVTLCTTTILMLAFTAANSFAQPSVMDANATFWAKYSTFITHALTTPLATLIQENPIHSLLAGEAIAPVKVLSPIAILLIPSAVLGLFFTRIDK